MQICRFLFHSDLRFVALPLEIPDFSGQLGDTTSKANLKRIGLEDIKKPSTPTRYLIVFQFSGLRNETPDQVLQRDHLSLERKFELERSITPDPNFLTFNLSIAMPCCSCSSSIFKMPSWHPRNSFSNFSISSRRPSTRSLT